MPADGGASCKGGFVKHIRLTVQTRWLLVTLIGLGVLAILLRSLVQTYLAEPAAQVLWWLRLQYLRLPQDAIWLVFLLLAYLIFYASLRRPAYDQPWQWEDAALPPERPMRKLVRLIENSGSTYARYRLCQKVSELALTMLAERTGHSVHQLKVEILDHSLGLPEDVVSYLRQGVQIGEQALSGSAMGIASRAQIDPRLYKTLEFFENEDCMEQIDGHS